jgi:hypothetical protein
MKNEKKVDEDSSLLKKNKGNPFSGFGMKIPMLFDLSSKERAKLNSLKKQKNKEHEFDVIQSGKPKWFYRNWPFNQKFLFWIILGFVAFIYLFYYL